MHVDNPEEDVQMTSGNAMRRGAIEGSGASSQGRVKKIISRGTLKEASFAIKEWETDPDDEDDNGVVAGANQAAGGGNHMPGFNVAQAATNIHATQAAP